MGINRDKARQAKLGKFWCKCDMAKVGKGQKCRVCGKLEQTRGKK